ncbi:MAG: hypothetical protein LBJ70_05135 [Holosporales bacterium]|nr:hypothetical protein [Holosporales bacterium]
MREFFLPAPLRVVRSCRYGKEGERGPSGCALPLAFCTQSGALASTAKTRSVSPDGEGWFVVLLFLPGLGL